MIGRGESLQKHIHDPMLNAHQCAFLDNVQDKEALTKWSYLWINVTEVPVGRASCMDSMFHSKDFYFKWGQARWSFVPGSGTTWQSAPLKDSTPGSCTCRIRECMVCSPPTPGSCFRGPAKFSLPEFQGNQDSDGKIWLHTAIRTWYLKWCSVCINARWDLARDCLF